MTKRIEIAGQIFDQLTVIRHVGQSKWECLCACGNMALRRGIDLRSEIKRGHRVACGICLKKANLVGRKYGYLTVVGIHRRTESGTLWLCKCDCGGDAIRPTFGLKKSPYGGCKNCREARNRLPPLTHGASRSRLYKIWSGIRKRCRPDGPPNYGGRGIAICSAWQDFNAFSEWALAHGYNDLLTIDRVDINGDYEPSNCEWVTGSENTRRMNADYRRKRKDKFPVSCYLPIESLFGAV